MNEKQIAFIICANNAQYYDECVWYIDQLIIPKGYSIDVLCIQEANSMAEGYNAGMHASNAKYKVYLHQDTFIINPYFLSDIIEIFTSDNEIGMIGAIGADILPKDACCYNSWNTGNVLAFNGYCTVECNLRNKIEGKYSCVNAIDGLIMVTQYDIEWREDILTGWDFYDVSHSLEMKRRGYKVVVPFAVNPWCYHDCGVSKLKEYDKYREVIVKEYPEVFEVEDWSKVDKNEVLPEMEVLRNQLIELVDLGEFEVLGTLYPELSQNGFGDTQIREILNVVEIYISEKSLEKKSELFELVGWKAIYEYYKWVVFVIRRISYGYIDAETRLLKEKLQKGEVSLSALQKITSVSTVATKRVMDYFFPRKDEPLVSVIIPVYNGEHFVEQTIESVLHQTYRNMEVIIIDDASTDRSREIISTYKMDNRVKIIELQENNNICFSGNVGFQEAKGKYVLLIGHDDIWEQEKVEKQVLFMEENADIGVCFTWVDIIDENDHLVNSLYMDLYQKFCSPNMSREQWIRKLLLHENHLCAPSACVRVDILKKIGYYRYGLLQLQDYELWLRVLTITNIYILGEKLVKYRRFSKEGTNISGISPDTINRHMHERQWVFNNFVWNLKNSDFVNVFRNELINVNARLDKEVLCEKALLIWKNKNCFAESHFMELLEDEECRKILKRDYNISLQDFYKMNAETKNFDLTMVWKVKELENTLMKYREEI